MGRWGAVIGMLVWALLALFAAGAQAQDWAPSDADKRDAEATAKKLLSLKYGGKLDAAYALFSPEFREKVDYAGWSQRLTAFNRMAGAVREQRLVKVTWFHDAPQAPAKGTYAVLEFHGAFENIPEHLENVILHRPHGGSFAVTRNEVDYARPKTAPAPKSGKK